MLNGTLVNATATHLRRTFVLLQSYAPVDYAVLLDFAFLTIVEYSRTR